MGTARERRWVWRGMLAMGVVSALDLIGGSGFSAPVAVAIGPLLLAVACPWRLVAIANVVAGGACYALGAIEGDAWSAQAWYRTATTLLVGGIGVVASMARERNDEELSLSRSARRLAALSNGLVSARTAGEVRDVFLSVATGEFGARHVELMLDGTEHQSGPDTPPDFVSSLVASERYLGHVSIWFHDPPDDHTAALLTQAADQVAAALDRAATLGSLRLTAQRLAALQRATAELSAALRTEEIAESVVVAGREALRADTAMFYVREGDDVVLCASDGYEPAVLEGFHRFSVYSNTPAAEVIRHAREVVHESRASAEAAFPYLAGHDEVREQALLAVPIHGADGVDAVYYVGFEESHHFAPDERRLVDALVALIADARRRASRFEHEEREHIDNALRAERANRLAELTSSFVELIDDRVAVGHAAVDFAIAATGARSAEIYEVDEGQRRLRLVAGRNVTGPSMPPLTVSLAEWSPLQYVVTSRRPALFVGRDQLLARFPDQQPEEEEEAWAIGPLWAYGRVIGVYRIAWSQAVSFDKIERGFLESVAEHTGTTLERSRLLETQRNDQRRWSLMAEASATLSSNLQPEEVVQSFVRWAVPRLADACTIYLADVDGTARQINYVDLPDAEQIAVEVGSEPLSLDGPHPIAFVHRSQRSIHVDDLPSSVVDDVVGGDERKADLARRLQLRDVIATPLGARGQRLGVLAMAMGLSGRTFSPTDIELVKDLAARFSMAYDNSVLFEAEQGLTSRLQIALLPDTIEPPDALEVAVRYDASGSHAGGDWYDLINFSPTRTALVVGDLVGHGIAAAATMSRLRSALRAYSRAFDRPDTVMNVFSGHAFIDEPSQTATVMYAVIDTNEGTLTYCSAGHPPPIVVVDGRYMVLPAPQGPLIGLQSGGYTTHTVPMPPGAIVVVYTDGLVERRGESIDEGITRLCEAITRVEGESMEQLGTRLVHEMIERDHRDDVALVVARIRSD